MRLFMSRFQVTLLLNLLLLGFSSAAETQQRNDQLAAADERRSIPIPLVRLSGEVELDGVVDEVAWEEIEPLPFFMWGPVHGGELTEETEVRIGYDDQHIYMSGRMYDSDPDGIRLNTFYRDQFSGDDLLSIMIDSYNDYETAVWFVTNPGGARQDRTMSNDAEFSFGGGPFGGVMNADWNSHWDVATSRNEEGWFAEFRIPFSTLGFDVVDDEVTMGIIVYRFIARKFERHLYPAIGQEWGGFGFAKPSQSQRVTLRGVTPSKPVYVTPYVLGGLTQVPVLQTPPDVPESAWGSREMKTREPGIDLKYSPSSNLAVDLTVNTDFAQVEADVQQINLTRFPLFFPEKRQFFQERASTFDFSTGGFSNRLFFSRRIGLEAGEIIPIYGGARLVGRVGGLDFGFLNMQTRSHGGSGGENVGVLRLKQQVLNPYSSVGGMLTTKVGAVGENNVAYGLDTELKLFGDQWLTVKWAQTFDEVIDEENILDAGLLLTRFERRIDRGFSFNVNYGRVGQDYLPRLGFQDRRDFSLFGGEVQYLSFMSPSSKLNSISLSAGSWNFFRVADGTAESRTIKPTLAFEFKNSGRVSVDTESTFESVRVPFPVAQLTIDPGEYWFQTVNMNWSLPRSGIFRGDLRVSAGGFYGGRRVGGSLSPTWNLSKNLELGAGYEVNRLEFAEDAITTQLARLRVDIALNTHLFLSTLAQYNTVLDRMSVNARFRYLFREGTDLWIAYNEGFNGERNNGLGPSLPLSAGRSIMVKYSHTLIW